MKNSNLHGAYTVAEFCESHGISKSYFYELAVHGKGPRSIKIGRRRLIPRQSAQEWLNELERAAE